MAEENQEGGIVKKCKKCKCEEGGGSAWEVAYGDFMTSMMAFFLVMWLIAATNVKQRKVLSTYFTQPGATSLTEGSSMLPSKGVFDIGSRSLTVSQRIPEMPLPSVQPQKTLKGRGLIPKVLRKSGGGIGQSKQTMNLYNIMKKIQQVIASKKELLQYRNQIKMEITEEGLRIVIFDKNKRPMFYPGSDKLEPWAKEVLDIVAKQLADISNKITIEGHTDANPYVIGGLSNWDLSTMRANAARREIQTNGVSVSRFDSIVGYGDTRPVPGTDPKDPINRRIVILVKKI
ncbi:flagellar motor protein MotB [Hippea maritima]|uniref:OmpA/MotB domain protein n=1 Tax=Hippea maritima (strain ATCC 700847 / DSM 10411 / MH2) TaxID=760142 RepID=F2LUU1_HIPMA|nr:flagellar motor protein MotB [Hippea maritima]AEA33546.1 OmpA/MotB domain protein [Hippea maritima DSM 10411]